MGREGRRENRKRIDDKSGTVSDGGMIKRCPECNRTYSDESISFCLADGALLSAPYDTPREEPPPTEILPSPRAPVPPTEPPKSAVPTMTSLPSGQNALFEVDKPEAKRSYGLFIWAAALALIVVGGIVIGTLSVRRVLNKQGDTVASSSPERLVAQDIQNSTDSPQVPTSVSPTEPNRPNVVANQTDTKTASSPQTEAKVTNSPATVQADPVLFPPDSRSTSGTKEASPKDYDRIFRRNEVDSSVKILSRPEPAYTESARKNQVTGIVVLRTVFTSSGSVTNISVIRGLSDGLTERAIAAAKQIRFTPATKDGRPVSMWMQLEYNFNLY